jgi:hypothetical protein
MTFQRCSVKIELGCRKQPNVTALGIFHRDIDDQTTDCDTTALANTNAPSSFKRRMSKTRQLFIRESRTWTQQAI